MTIDEKRECSQCAWFEEVDTESGFCRRNAPSPRLGSVKSADNGEIALWPRVNFDQWCAEFLRKRAG